MSEVTITDAPEIHHYELKVDGAQAGFINYRDHGERRVILHTEVDEAYQGQGLGTRLIVGALDHIREQGMRAVTLCPMATAYVNKNRDYDDIVDPQHVLDSK